VRASALPACLSLGAYLCTYIGDESVMGSNEAI